MGLRHLCLLVVFLAASAVAEPDPESMYPEDHEDSSAPESDWPLHYPPRPPRVPPPHDFSHHRLKRPPPYAFPNPDDHGNAQSSMFRWPVTAWPKPTQMHDFDKILTGIKVTPFDFPAQYYWCSKFPSFVVCRIWYEIGKKVYQRWQSGYFDRYHGGHEGHGGHGGHGGHDWMMKKK